MLDATKAFKKLVTEVADVDGLPVGGWRVVGWGLASRHSHMGSWVESLLPVPMHRPLELCRLSIAHA